MALPYGLAADAKDCCQELASIMQSLDKDGHHDVVSRVMNEIRPLVKEFESKVGSAEEEASAETEEETSAHAEEEDDAQAPPATGRHQPLIRRNARTDEEEDATDADDDAEPTDADLERVDDDEEEEDDDDD